MTFSQLGHRIDTLLLNHRPLWRSNPYQLDPPPWCRQYPALTTWLLRLSDAQVQSLQADDQALLQALCPRFPEAEGILAVIDAYSGPPASPPAEPPPGVPGRKWQQVQHFCESQPRAAGPVLEWCCGKSHLGRLLREHWQQPVAGLEIDPGLVAAGQALAEPGHRLYQCDVLSEQVWRHLSPPPARVVALHACGGLHQRLLFCAASHKCPEIALAPCCYHRFIDHYRPLSRQFQEAELQLLRSDLRSAVRQTCTARRGETRARRQLQSWQLSFRLLLRDNGHAPALALPSPPSAPSDFNELLQHYCQVKRLTLPLQRPLQEYLSHGKQALARAERLELLRMAFRRLLELRCVLDSVLYLEENDYQCSLAAFCSASVTPRNLLLLARRA